MGGMGRGGEHAAALQVIVLGSGGGPLEDQTTAFLVRSTAEHWGKGSLLAVDAGVHLAAISKILQKSSTTQATDEHGAPVGKHTITSGPFAGLELNHSSPVANAGHVMNVLVDTYLITHPHLDHISAFVVNTAGLPGTRQKRLAGLPSTIAAFSNHIFNNIIWPNLSDENNGAGLISYMRLVEGGSSALGEGEARGFVEVCEGLQVKTWSVSHGHCYSKHSLRGSTTTSDRADSQANATPPLGGSHPMERSNSNMTVGPDTSRRISSTHDRVCVYDSSVYFIRDIATGKEVLIFGDVEPDSISLSPRNAVIWEEAAPKIVSGQLAAIFIECSYDDSRTADVLFGHLAPRFLIEELQALAAAVTGVRSNDVGGISGSLVNGGNGNGQKRKRDSNGHAYPHAPYAHGSRPSPTSRRRSNSPISPKAAVPSYQSLLSYPAPFRNYTDGVEGSFSRLHSIGYSSDSNDQNPNIQPDSNANAEAHATRFAPQTPPLAGLKIVIIHVKEKLDGGGDQGALILSQLLAHEESARLGCEFVVSHVGQSLYF